MPQMPLPRIDRFEGLRDNSHVSLSMFVAPSQRPSPAAPFPQFVQRRGERGKCRQKPQSNDRPMLSFGQAGLPRAVIQSRRGRQYHRTGAIWEFSLE
jgi:hypothetical protein